jgi:hypothetical protein
MPSATESWRRLDNSVAFGDKRLMPMPTTVAELHTKM